MDQESTVRAVAGLTALLLVAILIMRRKGGKKPTNRKDDISE